MAWIQIDDYQLDAIREMKNGCILRGGVGSGKSRMSLFYYYVRNGGEFFFNEGYQPMDDPPKDLYIITTAKKRDSLEWEGEMVPFLLSPDPKQSLYPETKVVVDSWNNIAKYKDVKDSFFIFDEQRVVGSGTWVKSFLKIAKVNEWILLTATPGDTWQDYVPVFIANGFFKNRREFEQEHIVYVPRCSFPKIDRYLNTGRLARLRDRITVDVDFKRKTVAHHEDIFVPYSIETYKDIGRTRWDPYKNEPIQNAAGLCYLWRKVVNTDTARQIALLEIFENHPKLIIFYNFDYELEILRNLSWGPNVEVAEWNGHKHQPTPDGKSWVYLVQYTSGCEGWNCIKTDTIVFFSQNYSYKVMIQAAGRIDRLNTPFVDLYYYHLKSRSGIDLAISNALRNKKSFNETRFAKWKEGKGK